MQKSIKLNLLSDLPPQDDKMVREAMEIEIRGLKRAKQAIDEAAEALAPSTADPAVE